MTSLFLTYFVAPLSVSEQTGASGSTRVANLSLASTSPSVSCESKQVILTSKKPSSLTFKCILGSREPATSKKSL